VIKLTSCYSIRQPFLDEPLELEGALAPPVPAPEGDGPLLHLALPSTKHVGDLQHLRVPDLRPDLLLAQIRLDPDSPVEERAADLLGVRDLRVGMVRSFTWTGASQTGKSPPKCSIRVAKKRSMEPRSARWIMKT